MSKTKNKIVNRKNRREKGMRALFLGSKPHSKGDVFSRSAFDFIAKIAAATRITEANAIESVIHIKVRSIDIGI